MSTTRRELISLLKEKEFSDLFKQFRLRESQLSAVGKIAVEFSGVEFFMSSYISKLISNDIGLTKIITLDMQFPRLEKLLNRLFCYHESDTVLQKQLVEILGSLKSLHNKRNNIIHGIWENHFQSESFVCFTQDYSKTKKSVEYKPSSYKVADLKKLGNDITKAMDILDAFMSRWFNQHPTLHPRRSVPMDVIENDLAQSAG